MTLMTLKRFSAASGGLTVMLGAIVLLGWALESELLTGIGPGQTTMKANTAFCLCVVGAALLLRRSGAARAGAAAGLLVLLVGGTTLVEYLARTGHGIDELVFVDPNRAEAGRMGINTAIAFCLLGAALLFLRSGRRRPTLAAHACVIGVLTIALLAVMGYATRVESLYGPASYTRMALSTAVALILTSLGFLVSSSAYGIPAAVLARTPGGRIARRLLPLAAVPIVLHWTRSWAVDAGLVSAGVGIWLVATLVVASIVLAVVLSARAVDHAEKTRALLEEQLLETQKFETLGVLAGGIAHNFNNLLHAILGNASVALAELPSDSSARLSIEQIELAGTRAAELARDMLAYSGRGRLAVKPVDLHGLVEETGRLVSAGTAAPIAIEYFFEEGLPSVVADANQIRQVVLSLMTNAAEALGDARGAPIRVRADRVDTVPHDGFRLADGMRPGPYVRLEIEDGSTGMNAETLGRLFDPFFTTKFTGRGLGLAAVLGIIRGHGGAIHIKSELGNGTISTVLLPCVPSATSGRNGSVPRRPSEATAAP